MSDHAEPGAPDRPAIEADGKVFARKGEASTLGFAVVMGPRGEALRTHAGERRGHGLLLSALVALVLSPVLVWGGFAALDHLAEVPLVRDVAQGGAAPSEAGPAARRPAALADTAVLAPDIWVQLHAFESREVAAREAVRMGSSHADLLNGLRVRVAATRDSGGKPLFGLRAGAFATATAARDLCQKAQKRHIACVVLPPVIK